MQVQQLLLLQYVLSGTVVAFQLHPRNRYHVTMNRRPKNLFSNIHGETDVSIGIGVDDGSLSAVCAQNDNNDKNSNGLSAVSRREAFSILAATGTAVAMISQQQPSAALAMDDVNSIGDKDTLQEINIGRGIWTNQNQYNLSLASSLSVEIPTIFITYMTRFLINYDDTINSWWNDDIVFKYSRLDDVNSRDEYNQQLRNNFSSLAKSMEISLLNYLFDTKDVKTAINTSTIRLRFESLLALFMASYTIQNINNTNKEEKMKQILILFSMLPPEYQPVNGLKDIASKLQMSYIKKNGGNQELLIKDFDQNVSRLLPTDVYYSFYDSSWNAFSITPSILSHLTNTADEELFGSIASKPLKRQRPNLSFDTYSLLGLCGATGCALTHTLVIPFDVVKTRLQTNPNQYKNLIDGVISISKEETGLNTFLLGSQATIAGYFWYGLSVYPCYSFSKWYLEHVIFDPSAAVVNMNLISLVSGAIAAVVASIGLTPVEAARIRTVAEPQVYRELGLIGTLQTIAAEDANLGWKSLYAGFPSLVTRQVIFGSVKFLAFERACEVIFTTFPTLSESTGTSLGVTLLAGAISGALSSVVSQPADSILTYVAKNKGGDSNFGVLEGGKLMIEREGIGSLFRGLGSRCLWATAIISGQFVLYDIFRNMLGVNTEDLTQVYQLLLASE